MDNSDKPFVIESPTRIRLMPEARAMAKMHGLSEVQLARHLLACAQQREAGQTQREGEWPAPGLDDTQLS
jgi:hypothetical protein